MKLWFSTLAAVLSAARALPDRADRHLPLPDSVAKLKLDKPIEVSEVPAKIAERLSGVANKPDRTEVIIHLSSDSVASAKSKGVATAPGQLKKVAQAQQGSFLDAVLEADPQAKVLADLQVLLNAVIVDVATSVLEDLGENPDVVRVAPVGNYELDLSETVPYIGASAVQAAGFDGSGVTVAVLDSGVDYTHANLGGGGTLADYEAAYGTVSPLPPPALPTGDDFSTRNGLFPTPKVVEGYDFVGEGWPFAALLPDDDPIDFEGHGTHVADIIAGLNGVAPGANILAVKVCSAVSGACSGVALLQGMEYAVDPDGDGNPVDRVDVINMSLGTLYGQPFDDDLSVAVDAASALGVLSVCSAGNSADKPYVTGSPAAAETALSVAQTQVPSAKLQALTGSGLSIPAVFQPWSVPLEGAITGQVQYGDGAGGNLDGCAPFDPGSLAGLIVLVDRGGCNFSLKISNISVAGGSAGIIGLIAPGAPFPGADGFDRPIDIPGFMISLVDSNSIKAALAIPFDMTIDPSLQIPIVGQMAGSSSRGPQGEPAHLIKPEIGAPGASVSAVAGSGDGEGAFGGTSGAAPMVAGSAALLLQAMPDLTPLEVKSKLVNNGDTNIDTDPFTGLAPITRIGGGEVRVDRALAAPAAAWDDDVFQGALSFGFHDVAADTLVLRKTVRVRNYSDQKLVYQVATSFRFEDDELNGAVSLDTPKKVTILPGKDATFQVKMTINGNLLRGNYMNSGSEGANPDGLTLNEYDGYLTLDDGSHPIRLAWHVLPRKAANVVGRSVLGFKDVGLGFATLDEIELTNNGVGVAQVDTFALLATSKNLPEGGRGDQMPTPDIRAVGINTFPVPAGVCLEEPSFVWAFAINTWERQQHLIPVIFAVYLDTDQDGSDDYVVLSSDVSETGGVDDGRQLAWAVDLATGSLSAFFFAEHSMNTGNTVLYICGEQIGLTGADILTTKVDMAVIALDFYFGGPGDSVEGLTVTPLGEQYSGFPSDIEPGTSGTTTVLDFGPFPDNSPELGLLVFTNGDRGPGAYGGATEATEALLLTNDPPKDTAGSSKSCGAIKAKVQCDREEECAWDSEGRSCVDDV